MGKPKRDKTSRKDEEDLGQHCQLRLGGHLTLTNITQQQHTNSRINGDDEVEESEEAVDSGSVDSQVPAAVAVKKGKKGRRKKDDDWEDDIAGELAGLALEANDGADDVTNDDPELALPVKQKKKKKTRKAKEVEDVESDDDDEEEEAVTGKPKMKMGFQMLGDLDDNDSPAEGEENDSADSEEEEKASLKKTKQSSVDVEDDEEEEEEEEERVKVDETKKKKSKKSKQDRKKAPTEEDDIDAILAQIESTTKSSKKGKRPLQPDVASHDTAPKVSEEVEDGSDDGHQEAEVEDGDGEHTMKTAAEKKKEKKERQKLQRLQKGKGAVQKPAKPEPAKEQKADADAGGDDKPIATTEAGGQEEEGKEETKGDGEEEEEDKKKKKDKRKKKKGEKEEEEKVTKKKPSKMVKAMQEQLRKMQEEEERQKREEEERIRLEEEAEREKEEKERVEKERKEKAKLSKKERTDRLKAEGKFMTAKQKEAQRRAKQMLDAMKAQGLEIPQKVEGEKKKRIVYAKKKKVTQSLDREPVSPSDETPSLDRVSSVEESSEVTEEDQPIVEVEQVAAVTESWEDVKDSWEDEEENKETDAVDSAAANDSSEKDATNDAETTSEPAPSDQDDDDDADASSDDDEESESSEDDSEEDETSARHRAEAKILQRHEEAEKNRSTEVLRAPVVVVLGHVDTGKTKLLDKLRRTNVQDGEAGGITQQIGATNMPHECIREQTKMCKEFAKMDLKLPGMLIIDTPGHESFSNLRSRGSSLCDMAILVVDIMHGLEPQTIESMNLLKARKTPYIVALNKIDRLFQWQACPHSDVLNALKKQKQNTKLEFDERLTSIKVQFAEQGLNATLFSENKDIHEYISLVPTSAHSGDGIGNLIALICIYSQKLLAKRISYSEELQATAMEVKSMPGLGTTVDVILVNGTLHEGDTIVLAGTEGPIVTQIRGLLMPKPMKDFRVKTNFDHHKEVKAAQGVKIIAKDFEKALAGLPVYVSYGPEETEIWKEEIANALKDVLASIRMSERGVYVQASTLGSLEALLEFLRTSKIPYSGINIGPVHKKDIMKASVMLEHDGQYATILAFDVKVEREAQEMADGLDVKIFTADIIYHLFDKFMAYREKLKKRKQEEFKFVAVFPCKVRILPQYIFNSRDPIVVGVIVDTGFIKVGTPLCVPSKEFLYIGRVTSLELNHKQVDKATKGQEVCVKIEPTSGETPKMFGRHFDHTDMLVSKINRESIDAVKQYFRDEMTKTDWQLMVELKKTFEII